MEDYKNVSEHVFGMIAIYEGQFESGKIEGKLFVRTWDIGKMVIMMDGEYLFGETAQYTKESGKEEN